METTTEVMQRPTRKYVRVKPLKEKNCPICGVHTGRRNICPSCARVRSLIGLYINKPEELKRIIKQHEDILNVLKNIDSSKTVQENAKAIINKK